MSGLSGQVLAAEGWPFNLYYQSESGVDCFRVPLMVVIVQQQVSKTQSLRRWENLAYRLYVKVSQLMLASIAITSKGISIHQVCVWLGWYKVTFSTI